MDALLELPTSANQAKAFVAQYTGSGIELTPPDSDEGKVLDRLGCGYQLSVASYCFVANADTLVSSSSGIVPVLQ